jgi:methylmalonyl-CoA/ethylmalonyl-CoA epimerase
MTYPLDHVAIAVPSMATAVAAFEALLGTIASPPERVESQGVEVSFVGTGAARIELVAPIDENGTVARFLERRGQGLHHIAFRVADLDAELERLRRAGVRLIDESPRVGAGGKRIAFLHPESGGGVLIELVEAR